MKINRPPPETIVQSNGMETVISHAVIDFGSRRNQIYIDKEIVNKTVVTTVIPLRHSASEAKFDKPVDVVVMSLCRSTVSHRDWSGLAIGIIINFFPFLFENFQAEKKGCGATEYGLVFGIFELVVFLISPIYGQYLNRIGPRVLFNSGIFTTGAAAIVFGLLDKVEVG